MARSLEELLDQPIPASTGQSSTPEPVKTEPPAQEVKPDTSPAAAEKAAGLAQEVQPTGDKTPAPDKPVEGKDGPPPSTAEKPDSDDPKVKAFKRKAEDETRKRQDLEKQLADERAGQTAMRQQMANLEASMRQLQPQGQPQHQPTDQTNPQQHRANGLPDPLVDQEGYAQAVIDMVTERVGNESFRDRVDITTEALMSVKPDYADKEGAFKAEVARRNEQGDFSLNEALRKAKNPAKFAYDVGSGLLEFEALGRPASLADMRAKIREQVLAEIQAQQQAPPPVQQQLKTPTQPAAPPPRSLAGMPSSAPRAIAKAYNGPTPLDQILK